MKKNLPTCLFQQIKKLLVCLAKVIHSFKQFIPFANQTNAIRERS